MTIPAFPSPPTDNFYKFCALSGVVIFLFSLYVLIKWFYEIDERLNVLEKETTIIDIERNYWTQKAQTISKIIDNSIAIQNKKYIQDKSKLELNYSQDELKSLIKELVEIKKNIDIKLAEFDSGLKQVKRLNFGLIIVISISLLTVIVGIFLSVYGFKMWYVKIQKVQDILAQRSMKEEMNA